VQLLASIYYLISHQSEARKTTANNHHHASHTCYTSIQPLLVRNKQKRHKKPPHLTMLDHHSIGIPHPPWGQRKSTTKELKQHWHRPNLQIRKCNLMQISQPTTMLFTARSFFRQASLSSHKSFLNPGAVVQEYEQTNIVT
jgi:hypothetical protein